MKLIVGLGNVGKEYDNTRHNVGFMCLDNYLGDVVWKNDNKAFFYKTYINNNSVLFIKPKTFMNLSGDAVKYYVDYFDISIDDILVIHDDLDLPVGKVRIKYNSGDGGHNGIKSINNSLGTKEYLRVKIGISRDNVNTVNYVLGKFSSVDSGVICNSFNNVNCIINDFINGTSVDVLMGRYN